MKASAWLLSAGLLLGSCGRDPLTEAPVEGGNPGIRFLVAGPDGAPRVGVAVMAWVRPDPGVFPDSFLLLDSATTDAAGMAFLEVRSGGAWRVLATDRKTDAGTIAGGEVAGGVATIRLDRGAAVRGVWAGLGDRPSHVGMASLPMRAEVAGDGTWRLSGLPAGRADLVEVGSRHGLLASLVLRPGDDLDLDTVRADSTDTTSVLVDDFDHAGAATLLASRFPASVWTVVPPAGDSLRMEPRGNAAEWIEMARMDGGDGRGNAWKVRVQNVPADTVRRGAVRLGVVADGLDARTLAGISFRARGGLRLRVRYASVSGATASRDLDVSDTWQTVTVVSQEMTPDAGVTVAGILAELAAIEFVVLDTTNVEFWLDDVRFRGWPR